MLFQMSGLDSVDEVAFSKMFSRLCGLEKKDVQDFVRRVAEVTLRNERLIHFLREGSTENVFDQIVCDFKSERKVNILRYVALAVFLEELTTLLADSVELLSLYIPKGTTSPEDLSFLDPFQRIKAVSIGVTLKGIEDALTGKVKGPSLNMLGPVNIFEAVCGDKYPQNAQAGRGLAHVLEHSPDGSRDTSSSLPRLHYECHGTSDFVGLYTTWNLAFLIGNLESRVYPTAMLLIPCVQG
jgi:hypothetical protein